MNRIAAGFYGTLAASAGVLLLPLVVTAAHLIVHDISLSAVMREPESRGMTTFCLLVAFFLHLPMALILVDFAYAIRRRSLRAVRVLYVLSLLATGSSTVFYVTFAWPHVKYIPPVLY